MPSLSDVVITFNTHGDDKNDSTILHVFVKNRLSTSLSPEQDTDFISNSLAFHRYRGAGDVTDEHNNPYLASAINLASLEGFADPSSHTFILDQDNRNYSGICSENPLRTPDLPVKPLSNAVLSRVTLELSTHDDNKDPGTQLDVQIVNRLGPLSAPALAIGVNLFAGEEFPISGDGSYRQFI